MMIEILPNWHPVLVHFTIALFSTAIGLFFAGTIFVKKSWGKPLLQAAHLNLWIGAGFTVLTLLAGWDAYNTVTHDGPSHAAMTDHRNWALFTAALFFVITVWSILICRKTIRVGIPFLVTLLVAAGLLATTGFKGAEAVYRYGIGVMSMPKVSGDGGHGSHSHGEGAHHETNSSEGMEPVQEQPKSPNGEEPSMKGMNMEQMDHNKMKMDDGDGHTDHSH